MRTFFWRLMLFIGLSLGVGLLLAPLAVQAETPPCPADVGCIDLTLAPNTLVGDVLIDGAPVAGQVNTVRLTVAPNVPHTIDVNNFNDATPGFNDLFNYNPASQKNVTVAAGKVKALTLKPAINYLKGYVKFTCDIKGVEAGQAVACQPNFDGNGLPPVNPRETVQFALPNGDHNFHVDLVGPNADLWAPAAADKPLKITGNRTTPLTLSFNRKGQLVINIAPPGVVADIVVDDQPIAGQAPTGSIFVAPGNHKVEGPRLQRSGGERRISLGRCRQHRHGRTQPDPIDHAQSEERIFAGLRRCDLQDQRFGSRSRCALQCGRRRTGAGHDRSRAEADLQPRARTARRERERGGRQCRSVGARRAGFARNDHSRKIKPPYAHVQSQGHSQHHVE